MQRVTNVAARLAVASVAAHAVAFLGLHLLEPQVDVLSGIISDYSGTPSAWLATFTFLAFASVWACLALATAEAASGSRLMPAARILFALAALALLAAAIAPESADPRTGSVLSRVQNVLARPGLFLGVVLATLALRKAPGWADLARPLLGLAALCVLLLVATIGFLLEAGLGGLGQRVIFVLLYVWVVLVAFRILRGPGDPAATAG